MLRCKQQNDWRSTYGKNVLSFCQQANVLDLGETIAEDYPVYEVPEDQKWRVSFMNEILDEIKEPSSFLTRDELEHMLEVICCE